MGEAGKRLGRLGALTPPHHGLGGRSLSCRASAGPGSVQPNKEPQEPQDHSLVGKKGWKHGKPPLLGRATGGLSLLVGPGE